MAAIVNGELKVKKDWEIKKLGDICEFRRGLTYSKNDEVENSSNAVLRSNNIDLITNRLDLSEIKYISDKIKIDETKKVKRDSLLICTANGSKAHLGKVALIDDDYDFAFGGFMGLLIPSESVYPRFFYYALISENYKKFIKSLSDGANINNLKFQDLSKFEVPVPPREEQKRIVKILDEKIAQLETIKTNAQTNLQNAKDLFQSQLTRAFNNTTWEKKRLGNCGSFKNGMNFAATDSGYTIRSLGVGDFKERYSIDNTETLSEISLKAAPSEDYLLHDGDIVFVRSNGNKELVGRCLLVYPKDIPTTYSGFCIRFRKDFDLLDADFLLHFMKSESSRKILNGKEGANISNLNQKILSDFEVPLPPLPEQKHIVKELDTLSEKVKALQNIYEQMLLDCEELKQSFLCKAFAGEL